MWMEKIDFTHSVDSYKIFFTLILHSNIFSKEVKYLLVLDFFPTLLFGHYCMRMGQILFTRLNGHRFMHFSIQNAVSFQQ